MEASELRYKEPLDAARVFKRLLENSQNERENRAIIEQRNTILPKVISGELRVGDRITSD